MGTLEGLTTRDACMLDVFALGETLRYMLTGTEPDGPREPAGTSHPCGCLCAAALAPPSSRLTRDESEAGADAIDLIKQMTAAQPKDRITVVDAMNHPWIASPSGSCHRGGEDHTGSRGISETSLDGGVVMEATRACL